MERAKKFYGGLFGWTFEPVMPEYVLFTTGAKKSNINGGFCKAEKVESGDQQAAFAHISVRI